MNAYEDSDSAGLPEDLRTELDAGLREGAAPALGGADLAMARRIKRRLLQRVAADATPLHHTVQKREPSWQPFGPGVRIKVLHEADGIMSYLLELAAGAVLPAHRHPIDEECVVLEGVLAIGPDLEVAAGGFHLGRKDVLHAQITSRDGATIFLRGASPHPSLLV